MRRKKTTAEISREKVSETVGHVYLIFPNSCSPDCHQELSSLPSKHCFWHSGRDHRPCQNPGL